MARFYGEIQGSRGNVTRIGTPQSGIWSHIRGWNVGVYVNCYSDGDKDIIEIYETGGSHKADNRKLIKRIEK